MNARNALSRYNGAPLNTRWRSRKPRKRKDSTAARGNTWFPTGAATPDDNLRDVVAERFMSMSEAHDRIRTKLLATGR